LRLPDSRSPVWVLAETATSAVFSLLSMLAIGRVIGPEAAGLGLIAVAAFAMLDMIGATLFTDSLVQHPKLQPRHARSALTAAVLAGLLAAALLALAAQPLAAWSEAPGAVPLIWALAPLLPFSAFSGAASGLVLREQRFKLLAMRALIGLPLALAIGLWLAGRGYGAWAMVAAQAAGTVLTFVLLLAFGRLPLRPLLERRALAELWPVAGPQVLAISVMFGRYRVFLLGLGMFASEAVLAVSHFAFRMLEAALMVVWQATGRIAMPRLCALQHDRAALAETYGDLAQLQALLAMPLAAGVALTAPDLVQAALGPEWAGAGEAARIVGIASLLSFIHGDTLGLFVARGKAHWNVHVNLAGLALPVAALLLVQPATAREAALVWATQTLLLPPVLTWVVLRELDRPLTWLLRRIAPAVLATAAMVAAVLALQHAVPLPGVLRLPAEVAVGALVYVLVALVVLRFRAPRALRPQPRPAAA
jgi:O-antigen/teichoic acid export membrane protein